MNYFVIDKENKETGNLTKSQAVKIAKDLYNKGFHQVCIGKYRNKKGIKEYKLMPLYYYI